MSNYSNRGSIVVAAWPHLSTDRSYIPRSGPWEVYRVSPAMHNVLCVCPNCLPPLRAGWCSAQAAAVPKWLFLFSSKLPALVPTKVCQVEVQWLGQQSALKSRSPTSSDIETECSYATSEEQGHCWAFLTTNTRQLRRPDMNNWTGLPAAELLQVNPLPSKRCSAGCLPSIMRRYDPSSSKPNRFTSVTVHIRPKQFPE